MDEYEQTQATTQIVDHRTPSIHRHRHKEDTKIPKKVRWSFLNLHFKRKQIEQAKRSVTLPTATPCLSEEAEIEGPLRLLEEGTPPRPCDRIAQPTYQLSNNNNGHLEESPETPVLTQLSIAAYPLGQPGIISSSRSLRDLPNIEKRIVEQNLCISPEAVEVKMQLECVLTAQSDNMTPLQAVSSSGHLPPSSVNSTEPSRRASKTPSDSVERAMLGRLRLFNRYLL